jgi:hypothetical protein
MVFMILILLLALILFGLGFTLHALWWIAIVVFALWLIGWAVGRGERAGARRSWYGRW